MTDNPVIKATKQLEEAITKVDAVVNQSGAEKAMQALRNTKANSAPSRSIVEAIKDNTEASSNNLEISEFNSINARQNSEAIRVNAEAIRVNDNSMVQSFSLQILISLLIAGVLLYKVFQPVVVVSKVLSTFMYLDKDTLTAKKEILSLMDQLMAATQSHRALIGIFHNGIVSPMGHQARMSVEFEVTDQLLPISDLIQNISLTNMINEILVANSKTYATYALGSGNTDCDGHLYNFNIVRKDFKLLKDDVGIYGIINLHYMQEPDLHFLESKTRIKQISYLTYQIELNLNKLLHPGKKWYQKLWPAIVEALS